MKKNQLEKHIGEDVSDTTPKEKKESISWKELLVCGYGLFQLLRRLLGYHHQPTEQYVLAGVICLDKEKACEAERFGFSANRYGIIEYS